MKMSHNGTCRKCGIRRDKGNHKGCDRWPSMMSHRAGFHYVANSKETTIAELKNIVNIITDRESDDTPLQFEIRVRQVAGDGEVSE